MKLLKYLKRYFYDGKHRSNERADSMAAQIHWGRHQKIRGATEYSKAGATHWGSWYDEPTGPWPLVRSPWGKIEPA